MVSVKLTIWRVMFAYLNVIYKKCEHNSTPGEKVQISTSNPITSLEDINKANTSFNWSVHFVYSRYIKIEKKKKKKKQN